LPDEPVKRCIIVCQIENEGREICRAWLKDGLATSILRNAAGFRLELVLHVALHDFNHAKGQCGVIEHVRGGAVMAEMNGYPQER
jgi:hypothetical protein